MDLESSQPQQQGPRRRNPMEDLKREIMIMKKMKHNNIVTLSEVIDDPAGSKLLLVMEFMEGGPVLTREALEKRERLPESLALQYFRDMLKVGTLRCSLCRSRANTYMGLAIYVKPAVQVRVHYGGCTCAVKGLLWFCIV